MSRTLGRASDDATTTGLRRLRRGVRRPQGDEAVRPLQAAPIPVAPHLPPTAHR
jgi:hypothetical protein